MELAQRVGKAAFDFNLIFSIIITILGTALYANGIDPGPKVSNMFLPLDWLYQSTGQIQESLPRELSPFELLRSLSLAKLFAIILEFLYMMLMGFLVLVYTISTIIPKQLAFLTVPLFFIGAFIQLMVWIYVLNIIIEKLSAISPFGGK